MKALSLWQPYATLIAIGAKKFETRSWGTQYRGPLAIHAAKATGDLDLIHEEPFASALMEAGIKGREDLPLGHVVAIAELVDCRLMTVESVSKATLLEQEFGAWAPGRFAWHLSNVRRLTPSIPVTGRQGLFDWKGVAT